MTMKTTPQPGEGLQMGARIGLLVLLALIEVVRLICPESPCMQNPAAFGMPDAYECIRNQQQHHESELMP